MVHEFEYTPIEAIAPTVDELRATFKSQRCKPISFRLIQLRKLYWGLRDNETKICEALKRDLGKSTFESFVGEIEWCKNDIVFVCNNLDKWAKDEKAQDIPLLNFLLNPTIRKEPLGCVLVIGAYNVPFQLTLVPLIGAIAAGNTVVVKPSESAPTCSVVIQEIISKYLDSTCYTCIQGAVAETTALLDQKWDKIFYTGGSKVGKIIAQKAAATLTPYTLELGGRNPAIVTQNANPRLAARRLLWSKFHNAGQICLSQNYILIDRKLFPMFLSELRTAIEEFSPHGAKASVDYGRIVNQQHWKRLKEMINNSRGEILYGGAMDEAERFMEPTIIQVKDVNDSVLVEETFGPILSIFLVADLDQAIQIANRIHETPLAVYPFGTEKEIDRILNEVKSGGASINDGWVHGTVPVLSLGGTGDSGTGAYRGRASFDCFTHRRSITTTPSWAERLFAVRYPPYDGKLGTYRKMTSLEPNFDREGKPEVGFVAFARTVGAQSLRIAAMSKYALKILVACGTNSSASMYTKE